MSGDSFLFLNNISLQQLEQVKLLSELFRKQEKTYKDAETSSAVNLFCSEVEQKLGIKLSPVSILSVITLK